jgi:hypothetical protein
MSRLPRVSAKVADALIALAVAAFGAGGALAARHHDGHAAAAAAAIQVAMGLILYPRRRFPGSVLAAMAGLSPDSPRCGRRWEAPSSRS